MPSVTGVNYVKRIAIFAIRYTEPGVFSVGQNTGATEYPIFSGAVQARLKMTHLVC